MVMRFYIYDLVDSISGAVFYVGKGTGRRLHCHEDEARKGVHSRKCDRIRKIWEAGGEVKPTIVARFDDENDALKAEYERIADIGLENLTNVVPGGTYGAEVYLARKAERDRADAQRKEQERAEAFVELAPKFAQVLHTRKMGGDFGAYVGGRWLEFGEAFEAIFHDMANAVGFDFAKSTMAPHGIELVRPE